jgi:dGTPase
VRAYFEQIEDKILAPYAVKSSASRGQVHSEPSSKTRTCFQRDRDRVIHSKAFRRLKHKTQVFVVSVSDHYRSRLTHTLEVSQISRHLARLLRLNEDLCEVISLAHDLGHTPFGHSGERELNALMKDMGGFEHNLQSRRIVDVLERKYPHFSGLNLSFEVREGLIKHEGLKTKQSGESFRSIESQIVNLSDEIAYNNHDIDDGLHSGVLKEDDLAANVTLYREARDHVLSQYTNLNKRERWHLINSKLISEFIINCVEHTQGAIQAEGISSLSDVQSYSAPFARYGAELADMNTELRAYLYRNFYQHPQVYRMNKKGQFIIRKLFEAFSQDFKLLPLHFQDMISDEHLSSRIIADYIAGMTDTFAEKEYESIYK